jgi:uncharacterized delta-60 repeat protein
MHPDTLGWAAAALMVATFSCREARQLRPLAVATNLAFIGYGAAAGLMPVLALHLLLLPINLWRWGQVAWFSREALQQGLDRGARVLATLALASLPLMTGCGGGGGGDSDDAAPVTPPAGPVLPTPVATIGEAGGSAGSGDGAEVVVPAGALAADTPVQVQVATSAAPPLPAGLLALGKVYAFAPHGTTFSRPAQVTVPFDPALLPAGVTPMLYKADGAGAAAGQWRALAGATVTGARISAPVDSFSYLVVAPPLEFRGVNRRWKIFKTGLHWPEPLAFQQTPTQTAEFRDELLLGPVHLLTQGHTDARAYVYGNDTGSTYWLGANTPARGLPTDPTGGAIELHQTQYYRKRDVDASLNLTLSRAWTRAYDFDPRPVLPGRFNRLSALMVFNVEVYDHGARRTVFHRNGTFLLMGSYGSWFWTTYNSSAERLWRDLDFANTLGANPASVFVELLQPIRLRVPLDKVDPWSFIEVRTKVRLVVQDWRQKESGLEAFLRDPQAIEGGGARIESTGLDHAGAPPTSAPPHTVEPAPACAGAADPAAGQLQFETADVVADEGAPTGALVVVTRTGGSRGHVSARVATGSGSAVPGTHYTPVSEHVAFADGDDSPRVVFVPILQDLVPEADRTVPLVLDDVRGCAAPGAVVAATLTIVDDDRSPPPPASYRVGGTVTGLAGAGLVLEDRAQFIELPITANGAFEFNRAYGAGAGYDVRVKTPPTQPAQLCTVTRGSGTVAAADVTDIAIECTTPPPPSGLDLSFGAGTGQITAGPAGVAKAIALLPDGRIVAAIGNSVARYLADGTLDTTFGSNGSVGNVVGPTNFGAEILDLAVQADGRIVAAGTARGSSFSTLAYDFAAARLNADGSRDPTFNGGNALQVDWVAAPDRAARVLLQSDGKIVLAGQATTVYVPATGSQDSAMALVRLNADGSIDSTFGSGGRAVTDFGVLELGQAAALQPDGKIVVAGRVASNLADSELGVARFNADGTPDASFGSAGKVRYSQWLDATSLALQPDGRLLLALAHSEAGNLGFAVVRLEADGRVDANFGAGGLARLDIGPGQDAPLGLALQADGRIVVVGSSLNTATSFDFVVARLLPNGAADTGFGTGGFYSLDLFKGRDGAYDVLVQPDGKLLVSGSAGSGLSTLPLLVRFHP